MHAPQILWIILQCLALGVFAVKHGQPYRGKWSLPSRLCHLAIITGLLWWGGFFQ